MKRFCGFWLSFEEGGGCGGGGGGGIHVRRLGVCAC